MEKYLKIICSWILIFSICGLSLNENDYQTCFGYRFEQFMQEVGIKDDALRNKIRLLKMEYYPEYFNFLDLNKPLLQILSAFKKSGGYTAIASTAQRINLMKVVDYIGIEDSFSLINAGEDVREGKPDPEIYNNILTHFDVKSSEAIVFEDSRIGIQAAINAGLSYIKIDKSYFYVNTSEMS